MMGHALPFVAAVALIAWRAVASGAVEGNLLAVRVFDQVVSPAGIPKASGYRSEVTQALGLVHTSVPPPRDAGLTARLEDLAMRRDAGWRIATSYALLTRPTQPPPTAAAGTVVPPREVSDPAGALWRGRAYWARGSKVEATRQWRAAFGARASHRKRLAEALYMAAEYPLAIDEAMDLLWVPDCDATCRSETFELMRYWIVWQGRSDAIVRALCDRVLAGAGPPARDPMIDRGLANIRARRARTSPSASDGEGDLGRAEHLVNTAYVRAVRASFALRSGQVDAARQVARSAVRDAESDGHALILAGETLAATGDRAEARSAWMLTINRDPLLASIAQSLLDAYPAR